MITHTAQSRQSILDVAIAATGSIEAAYDIAVANSLPFTTVFEQPTELLVPAPPPSARLPQQPPCTGIDPPRPGAPEPEPIIGTAIIGQAVIQ